MRVGSSVGERRLANGTSQIKALATLAALTLTGCTTALASGDQILPPSLQRALDDYTAAWKARDAKALAALFAEGRTVVPNACPPVTDRAGVEACYNGSGGPLDLRALDHGYSGDLAYVIGEYAENAGDPGGGKFMLTLQNDGGRWFIVSDMDRPYGDAPH
jgi:ketosteroid isomerase-like protein